MWVIKVTFATSATFVFSPTPQIRIHLLSSNIMQLWHKSKSKTENSSSNIKDVFIVRVAQQNKQANVIVTNKIQGNAL